MTGRVTFDSYVRGYHVYKEFWNPTTGNTLTAKPEFGNPHDPYTVAVARKNAGFLKILYKAILRCDTRRLP